MPSRFFACCLAAMAAGGYWLGSSRRPGGWLAGSQQTADANPAPPAKQVDRGPAETGPPAARDARAKNDLQDLLALAYETRWNPGAEAVLWQRIRTWDLPRIEAALAAGRSALLRIDHGRCFNLLYQRWGEIDPLGALQSLAASDSIDTPAADRVLFSWLKSDPEAAFEWLGKDRPLREVPGWNYYAAVTLVGRFPDSALERAGHLSLKILSSTAIRLAVARAKDDAGREAYLHELESGGTPWISAAGAAPVFRAWIKKDPDAALDRLDRFTLPEKDAESLRDQVLSSWALSAANERARHMDILVRREGLAGSRCQSALILDWVLGSGETACLWLERHGAGPALYRSLAEAARKQEADRQAEGCAVHPEENAKNLAPMIARWRALDPAAADAWAASSQKLTGEDQGGRR